MLLGVIQFSTFELVIYELFELSKKPCTHKMYYIDWSTFILFFPKWTSYKTDKSKDETNIFLYENRSRHHNTELKYIIRQNERYDPHYKPMSASFIHGGNRNSRRNQWQTLSHKKLQWIILATDWHRTHNSCYDSPLTVYVNVRGTVIVSKPCLSW